MRRGICLPRPISIHALREEGDTSASSAGSNRTYFYPRPPRGGRRVSVGYRIDTIEISIHALREEGDPLEKSRLKGRLYFYPRPPRGGRPGRNSRLAGGKAFLSTPSARRATSGRCWTHSSRWISIHALREEGDLIAAGLKTVFFGISIHALREEGDPFLARFLRWKADFYPRPPRGGRHVM